MYENQSAISGIKSHHIMARTRATRIPVATKRGPPEIEIEVAAPSKKPKIEQSHENEINKVL